MTKLVSKQCVDFVKSFEGFSATPYDDGTGVMTIGYGLIGDEIKGRTYISEPEAAAELEDLLNTKYAQPIKNDLDSKGITLTQNQFDALVSMAYNVGTSGVLGSTLYRDICNGVEDKITIIRDFEMWCKAGGKTVAGLLRRRKEEANMFFSIDNTTNSSDTLIENVKDPTRIQQIKALEYDLNSEYNAKLVHIDGNIWQETLDALRGIQNILVKGHKSYVVKWMQQKLIKWEYLKSGQDDGILGEMTFQAITNLQKNWERPTDGVLRLETWNIFLNN